MSTVWGLGRLALSFGTEVSSQSGGDLTDLTYLLTGESEKAAVGDEGTMGKTPPGLQAAGNVQDAGVGPGERHDCVGNIPE